MNISNIHSKFTNLLRQPPRSSIGIITHHKMADMIYYRNSKIPSNTATSGNQVISTTATTVLRQWATQVQSGFDPSNIWYRA